MGPFNALLVIKMAAENELGNTQKMIQKKFEVANFTVGEVLARMVDKKDVGFIRHSSTFLYIATLNESSKGKVHVVGECFYQYYPWVVLKKMSAITPSVNKVIFALSEGGILRKWKADFLPHLRSSTTEPSKSLDMDDVTGLIWFVLIGWTGSAVVLVSELLYARRILTLRTTDRKGLTRFC